MKKLLFALAMMMGILLPSSLFAQSTEGTDFWVTLMRGDERKYDELSLTFSANQATDVRVQNTETGLDTTMHVEDNAIQRLSLNSFESSCYVTDGEAETPVYRALHVTSGKPVSLIAANYKDKSFDVAAILPTKALKSEYRIQCYTPYAHSDNEQGSQFAIVAADDDVVVDFTLTEGTSTGKSANVGYTTDTLKRGQVYYVWSGQNSGRDLSGSVIKARDGKKIAVFNGNSHTNIGKVRDRDHVFSQAMPVNYWGKRFAITSSLTTIENQTGYWERIDKVRIQAVLDSTVVMIDGDTVHTFDFASNPKHYYEFDFGAKDAMTDYSGDGHDYFEGASHYIQTSCPCAVHLFMTSDRYDHKSGKYCNGDPSEIWVNPIEQKIKELTFGTFQTRQVQDHFINIVTSADNVNSVVWDGANIADRFQPLNGNSEYMFARITGVEDKAHTLTSDSGFIAHVYGFGDKESYGYPAGGNTRDLTAAITINGEEYHANSTNQICGKDTVVFGCELNYEYDSIYWNFGDGTDTLAVSIDSVEHYYNLGKVYNAYVLIYHKVGEDDGCLIASTTDYDSIAFHVNIGKYEFKIEDADIPCPVNGVQGPGKIPYTSTVDLTGSNVTVDFDQVAKDAGFTKSALTIKPTHFELNINGTNAEPGVLYGIRIQINSECGDKDTVLFFEMPVGNDVVEQRYDNVLGLLKDHPSLKGTLSDFQWYRTSDSTAVAGQVSSNLNMYDLSAEDYKNDAFFVCYTINKGLADEHRNCACAKSFDGSTPEHQFSADPEGLVISAAQTLDKDKIFVNADWNGKTGQDEDYCYAQWIDAGGHVYATYKGIPDGGCTIPTPAVTEPTLYLLRVVTGRGSRSFKFIIQ